MRPLDQAPRKARDLPPEDLGRLKAAHARLREAVLAYEKFHGRESRAADDEGRDKAFQNMSRAQEELQTAEDELWRLRETLLGWRRPEWAPRAATVSDWFSEEDKDYDTLHFSER